MVPQQLDILVCPDSQGPLDVSPDGTGLVSPEGRIYPFREGGFVDLRPANPVNAGIKRKETEGWRTVGERHDWHVDAEQILSLPDSGNDGFWSRASAEFRIARRVLGNVEGLRGVDLACGVGWAAAKFARAGARMIAADFNDSELNGVAAASKVRAAGVPVDTVCCDSEQLPMLADSIDFFFVSSALHHFTRPEVSLAEVARVLKPGGRIVCICEALRPVQAKERIHLEDGSHYHEFVEAGINEQMFSQAEYEDFFRRAGLRLATLVAHWDDGAEGAPLDSWIGGGGKALARSHPNAIARLLLRLGGRPAARVMRGRRLRGSAADRVFVGTKPAA